MIKRQIPNIITLANLLCGVLASFSAAIGDISSAALLICLGIFFDFFDGMAARLLGVASPLGKELDSLADVVTSGVAPGLILFSILSEGGGPLVRFFSLTAFLVPLFAAYRLAKFNLDTRQSHSFLGLPTPANALIWVGLALYLVPLGSCDCELCIAEGEFERNPLLTNNVFLTTLIIISLVTDILMVSELPMFSLKVNFKDLSWKTNCIQYIFLIVCAAIIAATRQWYAISLIILWYILLSIITRKRHNAE
ncbi:MAG: CDP-alcohol phosphatidyltransferase family protein [Bacteroidales bacterium]|nr:CDP-alcohol phosphatidyltransferase family protein [Bacteroidales bacterium]